MKESAELMAREIINSPEYKDEVEYLCTTLQISKEDIVNSWVIWDTGINDYGNEIYKPVATRVAMHLHNYLKNSWHEKIQDLILKKIIDLGSLRICDIGFGTPHNYVKRYVLENPKNASLVLLDIEPEAIHFAQVLLNYWDKNYSQHIKLAVYDLDSNMLFDNTTDTYILLDSIEHAKDPTSALKRLVKNATERSKFLLSLPIEIENPIPEHFILWKNDKEAMAWLNDCGLTPISKEIVSMNPDIDIFAKFLHPDFHELFVVAEKVNK